MSNAPICDWWFVARAPMALASSYTFDRDPLSEEILFHFSSNIYSLIFIILPHCKVNNATPFDSSKRKISLNIFVGAC